MHKLFFFFVFLTLIFPQAAFAQETSVYTAAKQAFLMDVGTGTVLLDKNSDQRMPTSSMSKVMTMIVVFDALKDGRLSLEDKLPVSEKAWRKGGSKMFVKQGDHVKVEDLIRGVIVQSGNDATIVLAEGLAGSEENFANLLNHKAQEIGMTNSHFANASGWPDPNHYSTARDLAKMAQYLLQHYPDYYAYYAEKKFEYAGIKQNNRNPLLYRSGLGADGIKTGHTEAAGYGLIGSAVQNDRRVLIVLNGMTSEKERSSESDRLISWAFRNFKTITLFKTNDVVDQASVWLGKNPTVPLIAKNDIRITVPLSSENQFEVKAVYQIPFSAPVWAGDKGADLVISLPGTDEDIYYPLMIGQDVPKVGLLGQAWQKLQLLLSGEQ